MDASLDLERLRRLHAVGGLTDAELARATARLQPHASPAAGWPQPHAWGSPPPALPAAPSPPAVPPPAAPPGQAPGLPVPQAPAWQAGHWGVAPAPLDARGLQGSATLVQGLLVVPMAVAVLCSVLAYVALGAYQDLEAGSAGVTAGDAQLALDTYGLAYFGFTIAVLLVGIAFLRWQARAERQAVALAPERAPRVGRSLAVGGWLIPVANLVLPKVAVDDLWRRSDPRPGAASAGVPLRAHLWWVLWIAGWMTGNASGFLHPDRGSDTGVVVVSLVLAVLSGLAFAAAAGLAITVVRDVTGRLSHRARAMR